MFLEGRPPINLGVTSNGDILGGSQVSFGDVLGDQQFNLFAESIQQYRTISFSYVNLARRFQYAVQGYSQTRFLYSVGGIFFDPGLLGGFVPRDLAVATRTSRGGVAFGIYPFDRYRRVEMSGGLVQVQETFNDPTLQEAAENYQLQRFGQQVFRNGSMLAFGAAFVQETTIFREFGPLAGNTMRLAYEASPAVGGLLSRQTLDGDVRHYLRLGTSGVFATRLRGFRSFGAYPDFLPFGGNSEMRGYDYLEFVGQNTVFANAELRFPLIEAALTPIGVVGGVRGVFFANIGAGWFDNRNTLNPCGPSTPFRFATSATEVCAPIVAYQTNPAGGEPIPVTGPPQLISGFRLQDGRASYGIGLETFALGFPIHFDWAWRTTFNKGWEDVLFAAQGAAENKSGSTWFREPRFAVWIGYDF
jgi:hypothetical protein